MALDDGLIELMHSADACPFKANCQVSRQTLKLVLSAVSHPFSYLG